VAGEAPPNDFAVTIHINGSNAAAIVPQGLVGTQNDGRRAVRVRVIAELPNDPLAPVRLVELPTEPINASQRQKVKPEWFVTARDLDGVGVR
jgi:hypothetical protein